MKFTLGAYAASPALNEWLPDLESKYLELLKKSDFVSGLEIPFFGALHRFDDQWFLDHIDARWNFVITTIPGVMLEIQKDPHFGLASNSRSGRQRAIDFSARALESTQKLHQALGRKAVLSVEIHSGPTQKAGQNLSSPEAFRESLRELRSWNWEGATLSIEHCDRFLTENPERVPAKGFLALEDEIDAIEKSNTGATRAGILINWGRSALEERNADTPTRHIELAARAGCLNGIIFSGVTVNDPLYGHWADSHAPFGPPSLMTLEKVKDCLRAAGPKLPSILGFKIQALPKTAPVAERFALLERSAEVLRLAADSQLDA